MLHLRHASLLAAACLALASAADSTSQRSAMIWVANPNNITRNSEMIADLKTHRASFTGIAYQYFAVCADGTNDDDGSKDCMAADAVGAPHLAQGHPAGVPADLGQQLRAALGSDLELWPVISYGNPGGPKVLDRLTQSSEYTAKFCADAISTAHSQGLTGYNLDLETAGMAPIDDFLGNLTACLHSASPRIGISYDAGNTPTTGADVDRWISMSTYTSSQQDFEAGLATGVKAAGAAFGVGLCPSCTALGEESVKDRFDAIERIGNGELVEVDLWAYGVTGWDSFWPHLEIWLAAAPAPATGEEEGEEEEPQLKQQQQPRNYSIYPGGDCCPGSTGCSGGLGPYALSTGGDYPAVGMATCDQTSGCVGFGQMRSFATRIHFKSKAACEASKGLGSYFCDGASDGNEPLSYNSTAPVAGKEPYVCYTTSD